MRWESQLYYTPGACQIVERQVDSLPVVRRLGYDWAASAKGSLVILTAGTI